LNSETSDRFALTRRDDRWIISYSAMASPCEVQVYCESQSEAERAASLAFSETRRIEQKFSRYRTDNVIYTVNNSDGQPVKLDDETSRLMHYADQCYRLSERLFDITSGVLRKAWTFDGREIEVDEARIAALMDLVGWDKVGLSDDTIALRPGMELDLGGIGKEYAVDRVAQMLIAEISAPLMVNFGGDIRIIGPADKPLTWTIGIERPEEENRAVGEIELTGGGVATSGDARRFCLHRGRRLGHILNPLTGWPVTEAPRSVTVIADTCVEAGFLSTLAMLQGESAEKFLEAQQVVFHCIR
jgi:thiamine biosynthesis lipoprotein